MRPAKNPGFFALQSAIYAALTAASLKTLDEPEENESFPYITIGDSSSVDAATKTDHGDECFETVNVWSRYKGYKECKQMAAQAISALSGYNYSAVAGYRIRFIEVDQTNFSKDPDGITRHGALRLKFKVIQEN